MKETVTGFGQTERMRMALTLSVEHVHFDPASGTMRISGKNIQESKFVKLGQYHTIEIEANRKITIGKARWDSIFLERLQDATDIARSADVAAVVMSEGTAHLCLVTSHMTVERLHVETNIPRKRYTSTAYDKAMDRFFDTLLQGIVRHVDFSVVKCVIIASPGFVKDQFYDYVFNKQAVARDMKEVLQNKDKFLLVHASSGHKHVLQEVLRDPHVAKQLENTKAAGEVKSLQEFFSLLRSQPNRAYYGPKHVFRANELMAIQTLLITDELFRSSDFKRRIKYVDLVESVRASGGEVKIFSSLHVSGEQLASISGIAAILRFPLHDIDDDDDDHSDKDDRGRRGKRSASDDEDDDVDAFDVSDDEDLLSDSSDDDDDSSDFDDIAYDESSDEYEDADVRTTREQVKDLLL